MISIIFIRHLLHEYLIGLIKSNDVYINRQFVSHDEISIQNYCY